MHRRHRLQLRPLAPLDDKHVVSGNGGAPRSSGGRYGFALVEVLANGNLSVSEIDQATGAASDTFTVCPN